MEPTGQRKREGKRKRRDAAGPTGPEACGLAKLGGTREEEMGGP